MLNISKSKNNFIEEAKKKGIRVGTVQGTASRRFGSPISAHEKL